MIVPTSTLAFLLAPLTTVTVVSNLLDVCQGFVTPTHHRIIPRTPSPLFYRDEDSAIPLAPEEALQVKPPLNGAEVFGMAAETCSLDRGIFGAPTFMIENEIYWGKDRMEFVDSHLARLS